MPEQEFFDHLRDEFSQGNFDPYVNEQEALENLNDRWAEALNDGLIDYDTASLLEAFEVENPYDIESITAHYDGDSWSLEIDGQEIDLGDSLPDWVWDELYEFAADMGIEWDVEYEES